MIFSLWDLGGSQDARSFWRMYYANTQAIIFVVDSSDLDRMVRLPRVAVPLAAATTVHKTAARSQCSVHDLWCVPLRRRKLARTYTE